MIVVPVTIAEAKAFVTGMHRHHEAPTGAKFAIGLAAGPELRPLIGVVMVGRPGSRKRAEADPLLCEVTRLATDESRNACSMLYGAAWRAARAMGYRRMLTYTLPSESGASLRAIGARDIGVTEGRSWDRPGRPRTDRHPIGPKRIWELTS
jgi:hypothetical protein